MVWDGLGWFGVVWGGLGWFRMVWDGFGVVWGGLGLFGMGLGWFGFSKKTLPNWMSVSKKWWCQPGKKTYRQLGEA